ncbi:GNAT family N-acetyltransferase [uncultured Aquimarina sp.]|uniref:GNAT family N-acetyltransferase n=1 Tax=uncultured Aquimarina sp. TaxID=575652 RepID=UPI002626DC4E|nr:GNAT family N-acetyltransferase [uncultured Aquimarina sp.]
MKHITETRRLILREFILDDAQDFFDLNSDPEVLKFTGDQAFANVEDTITFLKNYQKQQYRSVGYGRWAVLLKPTNQFIGWCGLKKNEEDLVDLGFRFYKDQWNKGYATEAAKATLTYGFHELQLHEIIGRAAHENSASIRVLEKIGMKFWKKGSCEGIINSSYYKITKSEFNP